MSLLGRCSMGAVSTSGGGARRLALAAMCTVALGLLLTPVASAQNTPYFHVGSFDSGDPVFGIAVDQSTNNVYVAQSSGAPLNLTNGVTQFSASGGSSDSVTQSIFVSFSYTGVAVDPVNDDVYAYQTSPGIATYDCSSIASGSCSRVGSFSPSGPAGAFVQIASDSAGNVYYPNQTTETVQEFSPSGTLLNTFSGNATVGAFTKPQGVAVDSNGDVFVVDAGRVVEIAGSGGQPDPSGAESVLDSGNSQDVTADPVTNDVFVLDLNATSCGSLSSPCYQVVGYHSGGSQFADFGAGTIANNGAGNPSDHLAVDDATGNVYVSDYKSAVSIFSPHAPPSATTGQASGVAATSVTLNGTVNPNGSDTHYFFEYGLTTSYGQDSPPAPGADAGSGTSPVPVSTTVSGLQPDKTYHFQLVASSQGGTTDGGDETFTTPAAPPLVGGEQSLDVTQTGAQLSAQVNPNNQDTHYYVEDSSSPLGACPRLPAQTGTDAGSSFGNQSVSQLIGGLGPSSTYHYRVVAYNNTGVTCGSDTTLQTLAPAQQPGGRAFELVSSDLGTPQDFVHDQQIVGLSPDGQTVFLKAWRGTAFEYFTSNRAQSGWKMTAEPTGSALANTPAFGIPLFYGGTDAGSAFFTGPGAANPPPSSVYEVGATGLQLVSHDQAGAPVNVVPSGGGFCGACVISRNGSHFAFQASGALTAGANGAVANVYESDAQGRLTLISAPSAGAPAPPTAHPSELGTATGGFVAVNFPNAISADGARVYFSTAEQLDPSMPDDGQPHLYLRDIATQTTTLVSKSQVPGSQADSIVTGGSSDDVTFGGATPDGSEAFFLSAAQLTGDAPAANGTAHLYEYNAASGQLSYVARAADGSASTGKQAFVAVSNDGSHVFFTDTAQLNADAPADSSPKLYVRDLSPGGSTQYIAEVSPDPAQLQVSDDGQTLLFTSTAKLTPDATDSLQHVYLWRAGSGLSLISKGSGGDSGWIGSVSDLSSRDGGFDSAGAAGLITQFSTGGGGGGRALSADGSWAFFSSQQQLTPDASAGTNWKVYGYHDGELSLISPASNTQDSFFDDSSPDGSDVYFETREALVPQAAAASGSVEVYDARIGGGFPASEASTGSCPDNACDATPPAAPPVAGTVSFSGPGDLTATATSTSTTSSKVTVTAKKTVTGRSFVLAVKVPGKGTVTIAGASVATAVKSVSKAGTYKLTVKLRAKARRALLRKKKMKVAVRVAFKPANGTASTTTVRVAMKAR